MGDPTDWMTALGVEDSLRQTFDELVIHTPHTTARYALPWTFSTFDYRTLCELLHSQSDVEFETAKVNGRTGHRPHRPRRPDRSPDRGRTGLAPHARPGHAVHAAGRASVARARGASARRVGRARDLDRPPLRPGRLRLVVPRARRTSDRRRLVRPPLPREGHDGRLAADLGRRRSAIRATGFPTSSARQCRATASSSRATRPGTVCRSPPRAFARPSTSGLAWAASCERWSRGAIARGGARRIPRSTRRTAGSSRGCCACSGSCRACRLDCWRPP